MAALGAQSIASSYEQLLHVDRDGGGNSTTHVAIKDGDNGTTFGFTIATDALMMSSTNRLEFGDTGTYIHQSADGVLDLVSDTEIEINATTIDINGAVAMDGAMTGGTNITISGELDAATLDISGNADIAGTTNLDAVDIDGNVQLDGTFTIGTDGSGQDVTFYSATSGDSFAWDASEEKLTITGTNGQTALDIADGNLVVADNIDVEGDIDVNGTANLDVVDIDGAVDMASTLAVGGAVTITTATNNALNIKSTDTDAADIFRIIADDDGALFAFSKDASDDAEMYLYDGSGNANVQISGNNVSYFKGGNVGINEAAPAELLEISNSSSPAIQLTQTGGTEYNGIIRLAGNDLEIRGSSGTMELYNGSADGDSSTLAMSINSSQNFLFGGSEAIFNNATGDYNLYIGGSNSSNSRLYFKDVADGGAGFIDYDHADNSMIFGTDGTTRMRISSTGAVTAPTAPAFSATPDGTQSNPGNNTKIEFNTEIFDQGANFTNDTFTAPVTGRYQLNVSIRTNGGFDTATDYQGFQLVTSNRSYTTEVDPDIFDSAGGFYTFQLSVLADMDASDTALINHFFNGGTVTLDIVATSTFSGYLAC